MCQSCWLNDHFLNILHGSASLIMALTAAKCKPLNPYFLMEMGKK